MNYVKYGLLGLLSVIVLVSLVYAAEDHSDEIEEGRLLVESQVSCSNLTEDQLEAIGEYIMELRHPGEAHDLMHEGMGLEEGTEEHDLFHIDIANRMYCSTYPSGSRGMGMMMDYNYPNQEKIGGENMAYGMMSYGMGYGTSFTLILYQVIVLALASFVFSWVFWSTRNWLVKDKKKR